MEELIEIRRYLDAMEAEMARAKLESGGMQARVFVENMGGEGPRQGRLMVMPVDVADACEVLDLELPSPVVETTLDRYTWLVWLLLGGFVLFGLIGTIIRFL